MPVHMGLSTLFVMTLATIYYQDFIRDLEENGGGVSGGRLEKFYSFTASLVFPLFIPTYVSISRLILISPVRIYHCPESVWPPFLHVLTKAIYCMKVPDYNRRRRSHRSIWNGGGLSMIA
jgi:hypothetical protein